MRHLLPAVLLVAMTGCGADTKPEEQTAEMESANSIGMRFVPIPAGTFTMSEGDAAHQVTLTKPFEIAVCELTQEQTSKVTDVNPSRFKGPQNPVESVN